MRGLLIERFAGCKILQDICGTDHTYRVVTDHDRCIVETASLNDAVKCAEQFSKVYLS